MKATHVGTCQCCGHVQKLPGGQLSKHGYTKRWGFFSGVCRGAHHLPFEQSIDQIERYIAESVEDVAALRSRIESLTTETKRAWILIRVREGYRTHQTFHFVAVTEREVTFETQHGKSSYTAHGFDDPTTGEWTDLRKDNTVYGAVSVADAVRELNNREIHKLAAMVDQHEGYIAWQRERIQNWKPTELKSV